AAGAGQPEAAVAQLRRYADAGLVVNIAGDAALSSLDGTPGLEAAAAAIEANRAPVGADRMRPLAAVAGDGLVESVARDAAGGRWLVALVRGRTIMALEDAGEATPFLAPDPQIGVVLAHALDARSGVLWAATAPVPPAVHGLAGDAVRPRAA